MGKFFKFCGSVWNHWEARFGSTFAVILAVAQYAVLAFADPKKVPGWVKDFPPYLWLSVGVVLLFWACYVAWNDEHGRVLVVEDEKRKLQEKYFDERPLLGLAIHGPKGPQAWRNAADSSNSCWFWLQQLSGRRATAICFDPILSKKGTFTLHFDAVPFLDPPRPASLQYHIQQNGVQPLSAHDLEAIGDIEFALLRHFLGDSASEMIELRYVLTARFKDRENEELTQVFNLVFDKTTFSFLPNTT